MEAKEATHTPGPWTVKDAGRAVCIRAEADHLSVAEMPKSAIGDDPREMESALADARLIAAAPCLLGAAEALLARHDNSNFGRWCWCKGGTPEAPLVRCEACALREAVGRARGGHGA
jgi:hypothetical protein